MMSVVDCRNDDGQVTIAELLNLDDAAIDATTRVRRKCYLLACENDSASVPDRKRTHVTYTVRQDGRPASCCAIGESAN